MTVAQPDVGTQPPGWLHGADNAVLQQAADSFGLALDGLRLLTALKALGALLDQQEATAWAGVGLTPAQGWVLAHLVLIGPCTQGLLAQRLMVTPSSISQVTTRLEHQHLLTRHADTADRRVRHLTATPAAEQRVRAVVPWVRDTLQAAQATLGARQVRQLLGHLSALHRTLAGLDTPIHSGPPRPLRQPQHRQLA